MYAKITTSSLLVLLGTLCLGAESISIWQATNSGKVYSLRYPSDIADVSHSITGTITISNRIFGIHPFHLSARDNAGVMVCSNGTIQTVKYLKADSDKVHAMINTNEVIFYAKQFSNESNNVGTVTDRR